MRSNSYRTTKRIILCLALLAVICLESLGPVRAQALVREFSVGLPFDSPIVTNDDEIDAFIGTGGLLLPSTFSGSKSVRRAVASCLNCVWRYSIYCAQDSQVMCAHAVKTCAIGKIRYRVRFGNAGATPKTIGSVCWGDSIPSTREKLGINVSEKITRFLPDIAIGMSPFPRTLTRVPIVVWCGQKAKIVLPDFEIQGVKVTVIASGTWLWNWGDGTFLWTRLPGEKYPNSELTHQFIRAGNYNVSVKSHWSGQFIVHGIGKFTTHGEPITQFTSRKISVVNQVSRLSN